jgi:hypothetical protein
MHLILLVVGLLVTAAGLVTIGFGIPINAFSLGNTLIVAGTTAVAAGLVLVGLSAAVRQLQRIAEAMAVRPAPRAGRVNESTEGLVPPTARIAPVASRAPTPPPPTMPPAPPRQPGASDLRAPPEPLQEPRFAAAPAAEAPGPLDWLRPRSKTSSSESAMMDLADEAPLSPPSPARAGFPPQSPAPEHEVEPKAYAGGRGGATGEPTPRPDVPRPEFRPMPRATPTVERQAERPKEGGLFDVLWPDSRSAPPPEGQPRQPHDANLAASPPPPPPPVAARIREEKETRDGERRREPTPPPAAPSTPPPPPSPAILKSGVIDGMAYTLYADGSIEAELPQGTVKFASVDALRAHLENNNG